MMSRMFMVIVVGAAIFMVQQVRADEEPKNKDEIKQLQADLDRLRAQADQIEARLRKIKNEDPPAPTQARIAVFNLPKVIKNYSKFAKQQQKIKEELRKLEEPVKEIQKQIVNLRKPLDDFEGRDADRAKMDQLRLELQNKVAERDKIIAKRTGAAMEILYRDVERAAADFARSHQLDLVLYYNDALQETDKYNQQVLNVKIAASGMPIFSRPGVDITDELSKFLEENLKASEGEGSGSKSQR